MSTLIIGIASADGARRRLAAAMRDRPQGDHLWFASEQLLWETLTPRRWALLKLMVDQGSLAMSEVARRADRDARAVRRDVHVLLETGLLERDDDGRVHFAYDTVHVDFVLRATHKPTRHARLSR